MWRAEVEKVLNGYILTLSNDEETQEVVVEIDGAREESLGEQLAFREVFFMLRDHFGVFNNKHKNQYMTVEITNNEE